ncbi:lytic polysaccharide monooxygenase [Annulohypoxylon truncatum]|uniref:lytic polysaccharide monooxygenase n=1 Tax=Annulohypoxylon truncatum TaxID=327061 RepID=UPI0020074691|nr:lytic polysaccharide monooxygenase [Annulohypoxylon truncatum]KAI1213159.1 lytic polysaccharide monooxygenase [Annulohypoxylon truncatum]
MFFKTITGTFILASAAVNGHMIMANPKPFGGPDLDNSPLTSSNYPCKLKGDPATFYKTDGLDNTMAVGESQTLSFKGSAVHGGGSCQLAITQDMQPSATTSWQVIESIEGGCPSKSGQGADTYDWKIPDGVGPGNYVFAWTWISKLAGQPEYYMNCAPITVTGGKKRSNANETYDLISRDNSFPELFVANLADINSCKTEPGTDPEYPDPGSNVVRPGTSNKFAKVQGDNCVPKGAKSSGGSSGSSGNVDTNAGSGSSDNGNSGSAPASDGGSASSAAASSSTGAPTPSGFVTSVIQAGSSAPAFQAPSSAAAASSAPSPAGSSSPAGSGSPGAGSAGGLTGSCTSEGMFNCIGGTSYQQCASGSWSVVMQMPATTKCAPGQTMTLWGRDEMKSE